MAEPLAILATYNFPIEAQLVAAKLEAEGIRCFLRNELLAATAGRSTQFGGVQLHVKSEDLEHARAIIQQELEG